jgi:hypothetical protein
LPAGAAAALSSALLALVAAGCTNSSNSGQSGRSPRQIVLASVTTTESASSAAIHISVSIAGTPSIGGLVPTSGSSRSVSLSVTGGGVYSFAQKTGRFTIEIPATGQSPATTLEFRQIGNDLYLSAPRLAAIDGGKPWVHVDVSQFEQHQSQSSGPAGALSTGDPTQVLQMLQQLGGSVTEVGHADIDGVSTTEYQGQIDLTKSTTGSTIVSPQMALALGLQNVPVDVWVDNQGRARQVATSFTVIGLTVKAQEELGSFGTPVSVSAPPADEVADGSGLLQGGQLGNLFTVG